MKLPNFVVLGPPRTATTWLFSNLRAHREIYVPNVKEARFFDEHYKLGRTWYEDLYQDVPENVHAIGDITPGYFIAPQAPARIREMLGPDIHLFVIVRNPVDRAHSHYMMLKRHALVPDNFADALIQCPELVENSLYAKHIRRFLNYFSENTIRLLDYQLLMETPDQYYHCFLDQLQVSARPRVITEKVNAGLASPVSTNLVRMTTLVRQKVEKRKIGRSLLWWMREKGVMRQWHHLSSRSPADQDKKQGEDARRIFEQYFQQDSTDLETYRHLFIKLHEQNKFLHNSAK